MRNTHTEERKPSRTKTPTFLLELPLFAEAGQAARMDTHLEVGRQFYNAVLSAGARRLRRMRADPAWQAARAIPRTEMQERKAAFAALRERYGFSEYAFHELARKLRVAWLAEHLDAVLAQTLASRAYRALNRVCVGKAHRVRFKSKSRGLDSIENKRSDTGMRFVLEPSVAGNTIITEKLSYKGWQKRYGKSVGRCAPGMLIDHLRRTVAKTGGTLHEVPTRSTKLSQFCHGCGKTVKKPLWQRLHQCACGIGPVQRDLYSAFLAAFLDPTDPLPSCARYVVPWEGAEARLVAAYERAKERAKEGQVVPRSMGIPRARARLPKSLSEATQELLFLSNRGKVEAWKHRSEPPVLQPGEPSELRQG